MKTKLELRKEILALRDNLSIRERIEMSRRITEAIIKHEKFLEVNKILLFASFRSEVDTTEIFKEALSAGKEVYFPKVEGAQMEFYRVEKMSDLVEGYRGIREPSADEKKRLTLIPKSQDKVKEESILVIMPGAVFDEERNRIGYGGGYYDKFLQRLEESVALEHIYKIAIAFPCQVVACGVIHLEDHDKRPDEIVTSHEYNIE